MIELKIKFYDVRENLPEKSAVYLCVCKSGLITKLSYSAHHQAFNAFDTDSEEEIKDTKIDVSFWANLYDLDPLLTIRITNKDGCTWCDGVGTSPNGHFCGECDCINDETCYIREHERREAIVYDKETQN